MLVLQLWNNWQAWSFLRSTHFLRHTILANVSRRFVYFKHIHVKSIPPCSCILKLPFIISPEFSCFEWPLNLRKRNSSLLCGVRMGSLPYAKLNPLVLRPESGTLGLLHQGRFKLQCSTWCTVFQSSGRTCSLVVFNSSELGISQTELCERPLTIITKIDLARGWLAYLTSAVSNACQDGLWYLLQGLQNQPWHL